MHACMHTDVHVHVRTHSARGDLRRRTGPEFGAGDGERNGSGMGVDSPAAARYGGRSTVSRALGWSGAWWACDGGANETGRWRK